MCRSTNNTAKIFTMAMVDILAVVDIMAMIQIKDARHDFIFPIQEPKCGRGGSRS